MKLPILLALSLVVLGSHRAGATELTSEQLSAAQAKASSLYLFNQIASPFLKGDVIVVGGNGSQSGYKDYTLYTSRYNTTPGSIDSSSEPSEIVKQCIVAQAKEVERINELAPGAKNVFKGLDFSEINVYDNQYDPGAESKSSLRFAMLGTGSYGSVPRSLLTIQNGLLVKVELNIHLDQKNPCDVISAEAILQYIGKGGLLFGESEVILENNWMLDSK